ncbi:MAG: helix-turn-helix domain-containing protein [Acetobacteraceae bacterium]
MGTQYQQLCDAERKAIDRLHAAGRSVRQTAAILLRAPSTISRELRRNSRAHPGIGRPGNIRPSGPSSSPAADAVVAGETAPTPFPGNFKT